MTFKIGDRVRYCGPYADGGKADFGTIVSRDSDRVGVWWVDWEFLLKNDNGAVAYNELKRQLEKFGLETGSYNPETNQMVVQISLKSNDSDGLHLAHDGLNEVIPHIIPSFGYKFIKIIDHTLSEHEPYGVHIYEEEHNRFKLMITRWHRESVVYESDNLMDVLVYIQKHHHSDDPY